MPTLTIDGKEITVDPGITIMRAAEKLGIEIPRYCYHPGLSIVGQCRICLVEIEKMPKLQIACYTPVAEGMVVYTNNERVKEAKQAILEFLLINHPLDCPVCDQAGECYLQIYYMEHGLYDSRFLEDKVRKRKALPIGQYIILDSERCILCSRCVRFCDEITHTHELEIINRGDHEEITTYPGREIYNKYSGCLADICPVGALTDRDFRFKMRVWYLEKENSICPLCANACNIEIHYTLNRPWKAQSARLMRLKPRYNEAVNQWWMCDLGRYGYKFVDFNRLKNPCFREGSDLVPTDWDTAFSRVASGLKEIMDKYGPKSIGVMASPQSTNEENYVLKKFFQQLGVRNIDFRVPVKEPGYSDDFLIKVDKNSNTRGCELLGLAPSDGGITVEGMLEACKEKKIRALYLVLHDIVAQIGEEKVRDALCSLDLLVFHGSNMNDTVKYAHVVLPGATFAEKDGTFTNFAGRVQRINKAFKPLGQSLPDWEIIKGIAKSLDISLDYSSSEEIFLEISKEVLPFRGLTYDQIGERGKVLAMSKSESKR